MTGPTGEEILRDGQTVYRLPRSYWHCRFEEFVWDAVKPATLRGKVEEFLLGVRTGGAPHLLLTGPPGLGKTHLGVAAYRSVAARVGTRRALWANVPAFCEQVKAGYQVGQETAAVWEDYEGADRLVVLDDLFGRELSSHEANHIVYRMIDTAHQQGAAVLVTMNQDVRSGEVAARLPGHEISRLLASATIVAMSGAKDWRL